jgi:hypothetical protein
MMVGIRPNLRCALGRVDVIRTMLYQYATHTQYHWLYDFVLLL